ncbi:Retrovirus-related Pol polyprotein from type-1 retrotransposable element R2 [Araneus ventricosus]|uniref:Retrovirus-related Pol polyprotein from type-1 retrotransposable element R2 n=1 Tax=Araneus ventricosus TaxID=182803 RepID=A0A4Y2JTR4_ARAVE|nr:Retrovirus-related Pol polyprotein from type-1 retrotransposable element R2 [Araneus ventricosus]
MANFVVLPTISLIEPPAPSVVNNVVLSPPKPARVTSPRSDIKTCSVILQDILHSPSPISSRTRRQLRERQTAIISTSSPSHDSPSISEKSISLNVSCAHSPSASIENVHGDSNLPLDLSPPRNVPVYPSPMQNDLISSRQSSMFFSADSLLEQKLSECVEQLASISANLSGMSVQSEISELPEQVMSVLRNLPVSESEICIIANPVVDQNLPKDDSDSQSCSKNGDQIETSRNQKNIVSSTCPKCNELLDLEDSLHEHKCASISKLILQCHFCQFTAKKRGGLRLHMKKYHDTWKVPNNLICLEDVSDNSSDSEKSDSSNVRVEGDPLTTSDIVPNGIVKSADPENVMSSPACRQNFNEKSDTQSTEKNVVNQIVSGQTGVTPEKGDDPGRPVNLSLACLDKDQLFTLRHMKIEQLSPRVPSVEIPKSDEFIPNHLSVEEQLKLTPSPGYTPAVTVEIDNTPAKMPNVKYFPDSLRCSFCEQEMSSPRSYFEHVREFLHFEASTPALASPTLCKRCGTCFEDAESLHSHTCSPLLYTNDGKKKCLLLPSQAASAEEMMSHFSNYHSGLVGNCNSSTPPGVTVEGGSGNSESGSPSDFLCLTCNERFHSEALFLQHPCLSQPTACETMVRCPRCNYFASSLELLKIHLANFHSPLFSEPEEEVSDKRSPIPSDMNAMVLYNPYSLRNSLLPPSPGPNRNCPVCGFVVRAINSAKVSDILSRHMRKKHSCPNCEYVEVENGLLGKHLRSCRPSTMVKRNPAVRNLGNSFTPALSVSRNSPSNRLVSVSENSRGQNPLFPSHTCAGCQTKFTFAFLLDVHCARCDKFLKLVDDPTAIAKRRALYSCNSCGFVGKGERELEIHLLNIHGSRLPTLPSSLGTTPSASNDCSKTRCTFNVDFTVTPPVSQDLVDADDPPLHSGTQSNRSDNERLQGLRPQSIPLENCRIQDSVNIIFPFIGGLTCTEPGCSKHFLTKSWYSTRGDLVRHLKRDHKLAISKTFYWCSVCKLHIAKNPSNHSCIRQTGTLVRPSVPLSWNCNLCADSFTTETGLRNHTNAHAKQSIIDSGPKLQVVTPVKTRRRSRLPQVEIPEGVNEVINSNGIHETNDTPLDILTPPQTGQETEQSLLQVYIDDIATLIEEEPSEERFSFFCSLVEQAIEEVRISQLSTPAHVNTQRSKAKRVDPKDQKTIQPLFKKNRKRAVRIITGQEGEFCKINPQVLQPYFTNAWSHSDYAGGVFVPTTEARSQILEVPFSAKEVGRKLKDAENTSAGPDRLTYFHWKSLESSSLFLSTVFNACLHFRKIPPSWKLSSTILIPKTGNLNDPVNWRPIALSSTIYKLFTKCLASRLSQWLEKYDILSPCQKGFTPFDGVVEHNYVLQRSIELARKRKKDLCIAFLDISNAFGSLPHSTIIDALNACAGCPISGILFDICIDPVIREIQGSHSEHRILAFADDVCLLAPSVVELQAQLDRIDVLFNSLNLKLNPKKCVSFHLSGAKPAGARNTSFLIDGTRLTSLKDGEFTKFLGKPVGFNPCPNYNSLNDMYEAAKAVMESGLSQWMRIDALKSFIYPAFQFPMRTSQFPKKAWHSIDRALRKSIKQTLSLPERASNDYLYGHRKFGSYAIPILAEECELNRLDSAFKLLTSKDEKIKIMALEHLSSTVRARMQKDSVSDADLEAYMSSTFHDNDNAFSNTFTCARIASSRLKVFWQFNDGAPTLKLEDLTIKPSERKKVLFSLRDRFRTMRSNRLLLCPKQGKAMECVAKSTASTHFLFTGDYTSFAVYRFFGSTRLDLLSLRGNQPWKKNTDMSCRGCDECDLETLPHVLNHCKGRSRAWTLRHNCVADRLKKAQLTKGILLAENQSVGPLGKRPDLVFQIGKEIYIIDVTIPFENRYESFERARQEKIDKYQHLVDQYAKDGVKATVVPIIVGSLGSWDPKNDKFLLSVMPKSYLNKFRKLCCSDVLEWSRKIFVEHVTGHRQFTDPARTPHLSAPVSTTNNATASTSGLADPLAASNFNTPTDTVSSPSTYAEIVASG